MQKLVKRKLRLGIKWCLGILGRAGEESSCPEEVKEIIMLEDLGLISEHLLGKRA